MADYRTVLDLATIPRDRGERALRVSICEVTEESGAAHPYATLALFERTDGEDMRQIGRAINLRPSELGQVCNALVAARDYLNAAPHKPASAMRPRGQAVRAAFERARPARSR